MDHLPTKNQTPHASPVPGIEMQQAHNFHIYFLLINWKLYLIFEHVHIHSYSAIWIGITLCQEVTKSKLQLNKDHSCSWVQNRWEGLSANYNRSVGKERHPQRCTWTRRSESMMWTVSLTLRCKITIIPDPTRKYSWHNWESRPLN